MRKLILLAILVANFCFFQKIEAQSNNNSDSTRYIPLKSFLNKIAEKYHLHFFYKQEWLEGKNINAATINLPFDELLYRIKNQINCETILIDSVNYVFVSNKSLMANPSGANEEIPIVGDPKEYGKYSKAVISGVILDGKNSSPLPGATVYVEKLNLGTTSDAKGNFTLQMPTGEYDIKMSFIGYEDNVRKIKLLSNGPLKLELFEKTHNIEEVTISADQAQHNVSRTQMSLVKLDAKMIKELPKSFGEVDILKGITLLPGVQSVGEFGTGFNVRGGSSDQNLILIEDVPLFNSSHLFGLVSVLNPDGISNVTLLKGGIPAKYGERASSVMDIKMGGNKIEKLSVKGGIGLINSRLSVETPLFKNKVIFSVGGRSSYSNWLLHQIPDIDLMNSSAFFYDLNSFLSIQINNNNKLSFFAYRSEDNFNFSGTTDYKYSNTLGSVRWNHIYGKKLSSNLVVGFSSYDYNIAEKDTLNTAEAYKINSTLRYGNAKLNFLWLPNDYSTLDLGVNAIYYNISPGKLMGNDDDSQIAPLKLQEEQALEFGGYIGDNISFTPNISAEVGIRLSYYVLLGPGKYYSYQPDLPHSSQTILDSTIYGKNKPIVSYHGFEPRLGLRINLSEESSVKLSYNRINQYINLVSNTAVAMPSDVWTLSKPNIKPLTSNQYAVGYFRNIKNNTFETSVEIYYKDQKNAIEPKTGASILMNPNLETDLVNTQGTNYGIELFLKKNSGRLTGWASYTYSRTMHKSNSIYTAEQINKNQQFPSNYDKPHNLIVNFNYHISRRWRFAGSFMYNTGRPITLPELKYNYGGNQLVYYSDRNAYRLPDYHRLDISITLDETLRIKKKWKGSWTLSIINVYGRKNAYSVYYKKDQPMESSNYREFSTYKLYIIGRPLPTLTYNFTF